jgi:hypothetical protein
MFKKAIPEKVTDIFIQLYNKEKDNELARAFSVYCFFTVRTVDHKTFYWTKGIVNLLSDIMLSICNEQNPDESHLEYISLALYNLSVDNRKF